MRLYTSSTCPKRSAGVSIGIAITLLSAIAATSVKAEAPMMSADLALAYSSLAYKQIVAETDIQTVKSDTLVNQNPDDLSCFEGAKSSPGSSSADDVRSSTVMIMVVGETEETIETWYGSGSIVKSPNGERSLLTAAHVAEMPAGYDLVDIVAFDADGQAIGSFAVSFSADTVWGKPDTTKDQAHDIAVLKPTVFYGHQSEKDWYESGLMISADQSKNMMTVAADLSTSPDFGIQQGASGSAILNDNNEIIGILTQKAIFETGQVQTDDSRFAKKLMQDHNLRYLSEDFLLGVEAVSEETQVATSFHDGYGFGLPVINGDALYAMGYPAGYVQVSPSSPDIEDGHFSGFGNGRCLTTHVKTTTILGFDVDRKTDWTRARIEVDLPEPYAMQLLEIEDGAVTYALTEPDFSPTMMSFSDFGVEDPFDSDAAEIAASDDHDLSQ